MSTKIRLARHGRKGRPFYHVVIADSRAPRDGRYIEKIGTYNPNTNPATIDLKFDRALYWLMTGAQPTDTASRILSYKGVLLKKHLLEGVKKGAFDEAAAEAKFEAWMKERQMCIRDSGKIALKSEKLQKHITCKGKWLLLPIAICSKNMQTNRCSSFWTERRFLFL